MRGVGPMRAAVFTATHLHARKCVDRARVVERTSAASLCSAGGGDVRSLSRAALALASVVALFASSAPGAARADGPPSEPHEAAAEAERAEETAEPTPAEAEAEAPTTHAKRARKVQGIGLPGAYYRPDTSLGFGAFAQLTFRATPWGRTSPRSRPSSVSVSGAYTLRHQYTGKLRTQLFLDQDRLILTAETEFAHFPTRLYGFGNAADASHESYVDRFFSGRIQLEREVFDGIYVGWTTRVRRTWILDDEAPPAYLDNIGRSKDGGTIHGAGLSLRVEGRDFLLAPLSGHYASLEVMGNFPRLGSEQRFVSLRAEGRKYFQLRGEHVLALRGLAWFTFGDVPFYETVPLGRAFTMRGYYEGRYRDDHYLAAQVEYRFPILWRIYGATFVDAGTVFGPDGAFSFSRIQISGGGGLRLKVSDKDRTMLRFDAAIGRGTHGFVVGVNEAF